MEVSLLTLYSFLCFYVLSWFVSYLDSCFMFLVFFLLSFMFVPCFFLICNLEFCFKLLAINRAPQNWSSTYGQELLAFDTSAPNFGALREKFSWPSQACEWALECQELFALSNLKFNYKIGRAKSMFSLIFP